MGGHALFDKFLIKRKMAGIDRANMPIHIAIIMDGNGRWARKRGLPRNMGHRAGSQTLKKITGFCNDIGIQYLTVYAFSTENWKRPKEEVDGLMQLLTEYIDEAKNETDEKNIRIRVLGDISVLSEDIQKGIAEVEQKTSGNKGLTLNIALNYGARNEIVFAARKIAQEIKEDLIDISSINEELFSSKLYTSGMPDPDLVIRPSGEKRISNFLLWQSAYSEFWTSNIYWPDFNEKHLLDAIKEYQQRDRRFGGV